MRAAFYPLPPGHTAHTLSSVFLFLILLIEFYAVAFIRSNFIAYVIVVLNMLLGSRSHETHVCNFAFLEVSDCIFSLFCFLCIYYLCSICLNT